MPRTTLKKLAAILGLSPATVSKALKNYPDINADTKKRVIDLATSLNYQPNSLAQGLRNKESKIIGLIIPEIVHHFFSNIISGCIKAAEKRGYLVIVLQTNESFEQEKNHLKILMNKNVDGILLSLSDNTTQHKHIKQVIDRGIPIVLYDKISKLIKSSKVVIDDQKAAFNATQYLIDSGCKKIAHIRGDLKPQTTIDRFIGYKKAGIIGAIFSTLGMVTPSWIIIISIAMFFEQFADNAIVLLGEGEPPAALYVTTLVAAVNDTVLEPEPAAPGAPSVPALDLTNDIVLSTFTVPVDKLPLPSFTSLISI